MNSPIVAILVFTLGLLGIDAQADNDRPKELEFYGVVHHANGQPANGCELTMTSPGSLAYERFAAREVVAAAPATLKTKTDKDGQFKFKVDLGDAKWLGAGNGLIIARDSSGELAIESYRLSRGLVDLPLEIKLARAATAKVRIMDPSGQAVAGAQVAPARYGKNKLHPATSTTWQATTNQDGLVTLPAFAQPLTAVYVTSETLGQQMLLTHSMSIDQYQATALPTAPRRVRCSPPEDAKPTDIGRIEWSLVSFHKSEDQMELAWQRISTNGTDPVSVTLAAGSLASFCDTRTGHGWLSEDRIVELGDQAEIDLKLKRALHVTGQVVTKQHGRPLPGICLYDVYSDTTTLSQADGSYELWLPKISDGTYPSDPLEEYFSEEAFFQRPEAEHAPGEAKIQAFQMTGRSSVVGTVLDADGKPATGVVVISESKQERFTQNHTFLTDRHGSFRISNISEGTPIKLKVRDKRGVTESPIEYTVNANESPTIRLVPSTSKQFVGRIVDDQGQPVAGATVVVQIGKVIVAEGIRPADYAIENAFENDSSKRSQFTTDAEGRFETDECIDWQNVFSLKVTHPQFHDAFTGMQRVDKSPSSQPKYAFGDVKLRSKPAKQKFTVTVRDSSGAAVSNANVLFIQGRDFADKARTDAAGQVTFDGKRTTGIVAVRDDRLRVAFSTVAADQSTIAISMNDAAADAPWKALPGSLSERRATAGKLLKKFPLAQTLNLQDAREVELLSVLDAMLFANPGVFVTLATTKKAELEKQPQIAGLVIERAVRRNSALAPGMLSFMPTEYQAGIQLEIARRSSNAEARDENFAQALAIALKLDGDEASIAIGRLAMYQLSLGEIDFATELVSEVYENQKQGFEQAAGQRGKRGVARYFFPQVALVDFDVACSLIRTHAYPNEIESLQSLALTLAVMARKVDWPTGLKKLDKVSLSERETAIIPGTFGETPLPSEEFAESLLGQLSNERIKALLCFQAARTLPNVSDDVRRKWLQRGSVWLSKCKPEIAPFYAQTLAYLLRDHMQALGRIDPLAARQIAFACLEEMSELRDGQFFYLAERAGFVAEALSGIDPALSRTMLEPFLEDFSWHFINGFRTPPMPITSAAKLDPTWACTVAEELIDGELREDKARQADVLYAVIEGLSVE